MTKTTVQVERLRYQLALLILAEAAAAYARQGVSPLQETLRTALSLTDNQMALLQGPALAAPIVAAAIPLGLAIDRYSRVRMLLIAAVLNVAGSLLTASASDFAMLFAARSLVGLAATAINTTALSLIADLYPPAQRGRAKAAVVIGQYAGMSAAFALGGRWVAMFDPAEGWRWAMLCLAAPLVPVVFSTLAMREPQRTGSVIRNPSTRQSFAEIWRYRALIAPLLAGLVLTEMALFAVLAWAAPTLARNFALPPDRVGAIMAMGLVLTGILGPIAGGALADICHRAGRPQRTMLVLSCLAILSVPGSFFPLVATVTSARVLLVALLTMISATMAMGTTLFIIVVPNELRGLCLSIFAATVVIFGVALAPVAVSLLADAIGGPAGIGKALALVSITAGLLAAATFACARRHIPRTAD